MVCWYTTDLHYLTLLSERIIMVSWYMTDLHYLTQVSDGKTICWYNTVCHYLTLVFDRMISFLSTIDLNYMAILYDRFTIF